MTDAQHPQGNAGSNLDAAATQPMSRRQLLVGGAVLGLSCGAAGFLLSREVVGAGGGGNRETGQSATVGQATFPQLGTPMPGDPRPDAPELAYRGRSGVGVRTMHVTNPDQLDILNYSAANPNPRYNRPLTLEAWYPAIIPAGTPELTTYADVLGSGPGDPTRPNLPFTFAGRALRGARPDAGRGPYPLLIVSHGYPGSRVLLTNLTENLASKGYVVVAIDHTDSTHADAADMSSTLLNRALDITFVLKRMAELAQKGSGSFLAGVVDADNTALIGYSMGGYGVLICGGAGVTSAFAAAGAPGGALKILQSGTAEYAALVDPRIKAIAPIAPWGGTYGVWDAKALRGLKIPALFVAGNRDQTAPYEGVRFIFAHAVDCDRYLLVHQSGDHEVAVNPAPPITFTRWREYTHYAEPALDNTRTNNVNQHFLTAFLGVHLKGAAYKDYLDLTYPDSNDSNTNANYPGGIWKGFKEWSAVGLEMHHLRPQSPDGR